MSRIEVEGLIIDVLDHDRIARDGGNPGLFCFPHILILARRCGEFDKEIPCKIMELDQMKCTAHVYDLNLLPFSHVNTKLVVGA